MESLNFVIDADCAPAIAALRAASDGIDSLGGKTASVGIATSGGARAMGELNALAAARQNASGDVQVGVDTSGVAEARQHVGALRADARGLADDLNSVGGSRRIGVSDGGGVRSLVSDVNELSGGLSGMVRGGDGATQSLDRTTASASRSAEAHSGLNEELRASESAHSNLSRSAERASAAQVAGARDVQSAYSGATTAVLDHAGAVEHANASMSASELVSAAPRSPSTGRFVSPSSPVGTAANWAYGAAGSGAPPPGWNLPSTGGGPPSPPTGPPSGGGGGGGGGGSGGGSGGGGGGRAPSGGGGGDDEGLIPRRYMNNLAMVPLVGAAESVLAGAGGLMAVDETLKAIPALKAARKAVQTEFTQGVAAGGQSATDEALPLLGRLGQVLGGLGKEVGELGAEHMSTALTGVTSLANSATAALQDLDPAIDSSMTGLFGVGQALLTGISSESSVAGINATGEALSNVSNQRGYADLISGASTIATISSTLGANVLGDIGNVAGGIGNAVSLGGNIPGGDATPAVMAGGLAALLAKSNKGPVGLAAAGATQLSQWLNAMGEGDMVSPALTAAGGGAYAGSKGKMGGAKGGALGLALGLGAGALDNMTDSGGLFGAIATGAGYGAGIGAMFEGVGALPGALIGGAAGGIGHLLGDDAGPRPDGAAVTAAQLQAAGVDPANLAKSGLTPEMQEKLGISEEEAEKWARPKTTDDLYPGGPSLVTEGMPYNPHNDPASGYSGGRRFGTTEGSTPSANAPRTWQDLLQPGTSQAEQKKLMDNLSSGKGGSAPGPSSWQGLMAPPRGGPGSAGGPGNGLPPELMPQGTAPGPIPEMLSPASGGGAAPSPTSSTAGAAGGSANPLSLDAIESVLGSRSMVPNASSETGWGSGNAPTSHSYVTTEGPQGLHTFINDEPDQPEISTPEGAVAGQSSVGMAGPGGRGITTGPQGQVEGRTDGFGNAVNALGAPVSAGQPGYAPGPTALNNAQNAAANAGPAHGTPGQSLMGPQNAAAINAQTQAMTAQANAGRNVTQQNQAVAQSNQAVANTSQQATNAAQSQSQAQSQNTSTAQSNTTANATNAQSNQAVADSAQSAATSVGGLGQAVDSGTAGIAAATPGIADAGANAGMAAMDGLGSGMAAGAPAAASEASDASTAAGDAAASAADSESPSKVWKQLGGWMTEGMAIGISQNASMATGAASAVVALTSGVAGNYAADAGLKIGFMYGTNIVTGLSTVLEQEALKSAGLAQGVDSPLAKIALGQLGLLGAAGSGASSWDLHNAGLVSFDSGTPAAKAGGSPTVTINMTVDGQPMKVMAQDVVWENFEELLTAIKTAKR